MPDLSISVSVTRLETNPPAAALQLQQDGVYEIMGLGPGEAVMERETVKSIWVHGETLVSARKGMQTVPMGIRVKGTSQAVLDSQINEVLLTFEQFSYTMSVSIDGVSRSWQCWPADYSVGETGLWQPFHFMSLQQEITLSIPRHPVPATGTY